MKRIIFLLLLLATLTARSDSAAAVQVSLTFTFADTATRDAALLDYAKVYVLDIYSDTQRDGQGNIVQMGTTVDPAKVVPAIRAEVAKQMKAAIVDYRTGLAAKSAATSKRATEEAGLNP